MNHPRREVRPRPDDERGASVSVLIAACIPAFILICGLAVDGAHQVSAQRAATVTAAQAARVGSDSAATGRLNGLDARQEAMRAAREHVGTHPGMACTVGIDANDRVHVEVSTRADTAFLSIVGINHLNARGAATAELRPV